MKKLNNKGFGIVEGLLIFVIVGIVGGTVFYVYNANKKISNGGDGTTIQKNKAGTTTKPENELKTYKFDVTGLSFDYPKDYKLDDFGPSKDTLAASRLVFVSKISDGEMSKAGLGKERDEYNKYLRLSISEIQNDSDPTFNKKEKLFDDQKVIDTTTINGKQYSLVTSSYNGSIVSVTLKDCDGSNRCSDMIPINDKYFTQASFSSVANTNEAAIAIDTASGEYQAFIAILKSISVN